MLPDDLRLRHAALFERLKREGRSYAGSMVVLSAAPNGLSHNRYGFIASKRYGSAVARNRARRIMRESIRRLHPALTAGHDVALIARSGLREQSTDALTSELQRLFGRAEMWKG